MGLFDFAKKQESQASLLPAITSAGTRHKAKEAKTWHGTRSASARDRQDAAWLFYHTLPEISAPADYQGKAFSRLKWLVGKRDGKGNIVPLSEPSSQLEEDLVNFVKTMRTERGGDISDIAAAWAVQQWVAGESYLVSYKKKGRGATYWDMVSYSDLRKVTEDSVSNVTSLFADTDSEIQLRPNDLVIRFYTPDKQWKKLPYSSVFPVLELLDDLRMVQAAQALADRSRAASAGIFFVPQTWSLPAVDAPGGRQLLLVESILAASEQAVGDPTNPGASIPVFVEVPIDQTTREITKPYHVRFEAPNDEMLKHKYDRLINRIAIGLGAPIEMITGERGNHWNAWASSEEGFSLHIAPAADQFCTDMTRLLIWPAMQTLGHSVAELEEYFLTFDPSKFITRPNNMEYVRYGHSTMVVSDRTFRERIGLTEDDAPTEKEIAERMAREGLPFPSDRARERPRSTPDRVVPDLPEEDSPDDVTNELAVKVAVAADTWFGRCRERGGSRIRSKVSKNSEIYDSISEADNAEVWSHVSRSVLESYNISMTYILQDASKGLHSQIAMYTNDRLARLLVPYIESLYETYFFDPAPDIYADVFKRAKTLLTTR